MRGSAPGLDPPDLRPQARRRRDDGAQARHPERSAEGWKVPRVVGEEGAKGRTYGGNSLDVTKSYIPDFQFPNVPGTGHFLMMEKPAEFNQQAIEFVDRQRF